MIKDMPHLQSALAAYSEELAQSYGDGLIGIYLYGSFARGCYHPSTSDVDTIVVVHDDCVIPDDAVILQIHRNLGVPVDTVFVTESQLNTDASPSPVVYLVKLNFGDIIRVPEGRRDFLLQRQDAYEAGLALFGPSPKELIRPVPWPLLADSLDFLFPHILPYFKNPVLMLSRIVYAWTHRKLCSKRDAGEWAMAAFDEHWAPMLKTALAEYAGGQKTSATQEELKAFEQHCAELIAKFR